MAEQPKSDLCERTFLFAVAITNLCRKLDRTPGTMRQLGRQLFDSGTSVGANYEEGQAGQSRADFISKTNIALKEARETHFWLRLLRATGMDASADSAGLLDEADQLKRILGAIVSRFRRGPAES